MSDLNMQEQKSRILQYSSNGSALILLCVFEFSVILSLLPEVHQSLLPLSSDVYIYQLVNEQLQTSDALRPV